MTPASIDLTTGTPTSIAASKDTDQKAVQHLQSWVDRLGTFGNDESWCNYNTGVGSFTVDGVDVEKGSQFVCDPNSDATRDSYVLADLSLDNVSLAVMGEKEIW